MRRQFSNPEREEYRMHYYCFDLYRGLAQRNKKRGGSLAKLQEITGLGDWSRGEMDDMRRKIYAG